MATVGSSLSPPGPGSNVTLQQSSPSANPFCWVTGYAACPPLILPFYQSIIFIVPMIFTIVLLFLLCTIYIRNRRFRLAQQLHQTQLHSILVAGGTLPASGGLDEARKAAFPTMTHAEAMAMLPKTTQVDTQCPVCLGEYAATECLRLLPCHAFHRDCIDAWLQQHATCPTCHTSLGGLGEEVAAV